MIIFLNFKLKKKEIKNTGTVKFGKNIMIIQTIETYSTRQISIVKITTDEGQEGWGQIAPFQADISAAVLHRQLARPVLGENPLEIESLVEKCLVRTHKFPGSYVCRALAGIDTALWDLKGKLENKSVHQLFNSKKNIIPAYASSVNRNITPEDEAERMKKHQAESGFQAFKIRIANNFGKDIDKWPGRTESIVPAVSKAIGNKASLLVDANSGYSPGKAIETGRFLQDNGVCHFEEPCPYWELEWTKKVTDSLDLDVTGGEQDNWLPTWKRMINMHAVDIVQPDVCYVGGFHRAMQVAELAHKKNIPCTPHSANLSMVTLFSLHLLSVIPNAGKYLEYSIEKQEWAQNIYTPALTVKDGKVRIPDACPGWGVVVNQSWLDKAEYQVCVWEDKK